MLEKTRNRLKIEFIKNCEIDKIIKQQSKLTFNGNHISFKKYCTFTFKQMELLWMNL